MGATELAATKLDDSPQVGGHDCALLLCALVPDASALEHAELGGSAVCARSALKRTHLGGATELDATKVDDKQWSGAAPAGGNDRGHLRARTAAHDAGRSGDGTGPTPIAWLPPHKARKRQLEGPR